MNTATAKQPRQPIFSDFLTDITNRLQAVSDSYLENFDEHAAFDYLIAELYETTNPSKFVFSDGPGDGGIDFFIRDTPSYTICQCKCPELDIMSSDATVPKFDRRGLNELVAGIDILRDPRGKYDVALNIKRLRGDYQRDLLADPDQTTLTAILAVLGDLTGPAKTAFHSKRDELAQEGIILKLITWKDISHQLNVFATPEDINFKITIHCDDEKKDILSNRDYCYVLAHGIDFYNAFREHEWNLFEWNVRLQMHNSAINKRIVSSLSHMRTQKDFHHYNNGLLITCKSYSINRNANTITLTMSWGHCSRASRPTGRA
ncbi:MAG: AIPR family protein [Proteobacteria bacterium]|nr:AIPR family protein [Pseudomonadota bacterium]